MSELTKKVSVRAIKEAFHLKQVCGDDSSLDRWTIAPDINRPGLELSGYRIAAELKRIVIIGKKEYRYIGSLDYDTQKDRFGFLTDSYTPCIIITSANPAPQALLYVAREKNFPVFEFDGETYQLTSDLTVYLTNHLAPSDYVHGGLMNIYGVGVAIMGDSGIGKSELELDLIKRGHIFVADDIINVRKINNDLIGEAPDNLKKMLEVRGVGVIDVNVMFGGHCYLQKCPINFVIKLINFSEYTQANPNRLDPLENHIEILGVKKRILEIPITEGKSMSTIVETAVTKYIMSRQGIDTNEAFKQRIFDEIANKE
ncbi:MAG: HPr(Ser) kinase/phosphatase [Erysipelotrichaceae bacterium]|nr:HPr(Ser) kinase/phosphatase [Erysipelotrichaceae bacterium]